MFNHLTTRWPAGASESTAWFRRGQPRSSPVSPFSVPAAPARSPAILTVSRPSARSFPPALVTETRAKLSVRPRRVQVPSAIRSSPGATDMYCTFIETVVSRLPRLKSWPEMTAPEPVVSMSVATTPPWKTPSCADSRSAKGTRARTRPGSQSRISMPISWLKAIWLLQCSRNHSCLASSACGVSVIDGSLWIAPRARSLLRPGDGFELGRALRHETPDPLAEVRMLFVPVRLQAKRLEPGRLERRFGGRVDLRLHGGDGDWRAVGGDVSRVVQGMGEVGR